MTCEELKQKATFCKSGKKSFLISYAGSSMRPMFREGDLLEVSQGYNNDIRKGDVIVFSHPFIEQLVIHRVMGVCKEGIITRGDNCAQNDPWFVEPEHVYGKVTGFNRGRAFADVSGGASGVVYALGVRTIFRFTRRLAGLIMPVYHHFSGRGLFRIFLPRRLRPRLMFVTFFKKSRHILFSGRKVIGYYDEIEKSWNIIKPYGLFVDVAGLPDKYS